MRISDFSLFFILIKATALQQRISFCVKGKTLTEIEGILTVQTSLHQEKMSFTVIRGLSIAIAR